MDEKDFIEYWRGIISGELLKEFPNDYIQNVKTETMELPGKRLILGSELFGSFEIIDVEGNPVFQIGGFTKAKYVLYSNRKKPTEIPVPVNESDLIKAVKEYETHLDEIVKRIEKDYKKMLPGGSRFHDVSNQIFNYLNLIRY